MLCSDWLKAGRLKDKKKVRISIVRLYNCKIVRGWNGNFTFSSSFNQSQEGSLVNNEDWCYDWLNEEQKVQFPLNCCTNV